MTNVAIENGHWNSGFIFPLKMVIFHSYVKLPEGTSRIGLVAWVCTPSSLILRLWQRGLLLRTSHHRLFSLESRSKRRRYLKSNQASKPVQQLRLASFVLDGHFQAWLQRSQQFSIYPHGKSLVCHISIIFHIFPWTARQNMLEVVRSGSGGYWAGSARSAEGYGRSPNFSKRQASCCEAGDPVVSIRPWELSFAAGFWDNLNMHQTFLLVQLIPLETFNLGTALVC